MPSFSLRSRVFGAGFAAISRANATAPASRSPSIMRSTMPNFSASSAEIGIALCAHLDGFGDARESWEALRSRARPE